MDTAAYSAIWVNFKKLPDYPWPSAMPNISGTWVGSVTELARFQKLKDELTNFDTLAVEFLVWNHPK